MNDLLIEIGCEDLPARYVQPLVAALSAAFVEGLGRRQVALGASRSFATPRRITVLIEAVGEEQAEQAILRKGPKLAAAIKDGQPTPAGLGFAKSCGVDFAALAQEDGQLVFRQTAPGRATAELLPEIFEEALKAMDELVPKRMRWGAGTETFVRPVQWLLAMLGEQVVPIQRFGLTAGSITYGHRFHAPAAIVLEKPADYEAALREAKVWADFASRREHIRRGIEAEAARLGGSARITEDLLDEVTALVEWPVVISGAIEERFLQLPPEVIVATVETNQRYFTVFGDTPMIAGQFRSGEDAGGGYLKPVFITVSNIESKDVAQVIAGNERVVRPRLTDALFFWEQDRKQPLPEYVDTLDRVTYVNNLGTLLDKTRKVEDLADAIAQALQINAGEIRSAAELCKADLVTRMVFEFPELQGLMGGYYARASGASETVALAITEHYRPTQAGGPIPSSIEGKVVALADKLHALVGIFAIGQKPTASKDPFALRRAALGAIRILVEGRLDLDLKQILQVAFRSLPTSLSSTGAGSGAVLDELLTFVFERLRGYALERGHSAEAFEAVRALEILRPLDFMLRLEALSGFSATPAAASLAAADKRARNILKQAGGASTETVSAKRFESPTEHALLAAIEQVDAELAPLRATRNYTEMLTRLSRLKEPVDAFMDPATGVRVMADDPAVRANRLALLARLDALCREVADLSCLPG